MRNKRVHGSFENAENIDDLQGNKKRHNVDYQ